MERMVREEVRRIDTILCVRVLGYARHDQLTFDTVDNRQLHLHENILKGYFVLSFRMKQRSCGLTAVHDLQIADAGDLEAALTGLDFDLLGCCCNSIVIGKEHLRFGENGCPDALIHLAPLLKEGPDVLLKQPRTELAVEACKDVC